jgi:hypothetical protein
MTPHVLRLSFLLAGCTLLLAGCADVDQPRYVAGDAGEARLTNPTTGRIHLDGCSPFSFEKWEGAHWIDRGPAWVCVWQGYAQPVESHAVSTAAFTAPDEPGTWRLRFPIGLGCRDDAPLEPGSCSWIGSSETAPFEVQGLCREEDCGPALGMPNWVCDDGSVGGPTGRCLLDAETRACGWEVRSCP